MEKVPHGPPKLLSESPESFKMDAPESPQTKKSTSAIGFVLTMAGIAAFFVFTMWTWNTKNGVIPEDQRVIKVDSHGGHGDSHGSDHGADHGEGHEEPSHETTVPHGEPVMKTVPAEPGQAGIESHGTASPGEGH